MGIPHTRVLLCLDTLFDVVEEFKSESGDWYNGQRKQDTLKLCKLIKSGNLLVYVPPALVSVYHAAINNLYGGRVASHSVEHLLRFANCDLELDFHSILRKANAVVHQVEDADLYEVIGLVCAEALNAHAFIAQKPEEYGRVAAAFEEFGGFKIPVLDTSTFIRWYTNQESSSPRDESTICVFTPQFEMKRLPRGATAVDFAYQIHTKVGDRCIKALNLGKEIPLDSPLQNGEFIEIVKGTEVTANAAWLKFVVTSLAKRNIQRAIKRETHQRGWQRIKEALEGNLRFYRQALDTIAEQRHCHANDLAVQVGSGELSIEALLKLIHELQVQQLTTPPDWIGVGSQWRLASCCNPLPGDPAIGLIAGNRPMRIHRMDCPNVQAIVPNARHLIDWKADRYSIQLQLTIKNTKDIIRTILNRLAKDDITPDFRGFTPISDGRAKIAIGLNFISRQELDEVCAKIQAIPDVEDKKLTRVMIHQESRLLLQQSPFHQGIV